MSMGGMSFASGSADDGVTVGTFTAYEGAQKAVSQLIAAEVPARKIAIVGEGLRSIERVTGKLGYARAARSGALNGLMIGIVLAAIFVIGNPNVPIQAFVGVLFVGIAAGMLMSLVMFAAVRRRRDFASVMQIAAERYEVKVDAGYVQKARAALGATPQVRPSTPPAAATEPPRYGERLPQSPSDAGAAASD